LTVLDHFTKYLWTHAFKTKDAGPIATWLMHTFMENVCMPERWHADNGGEFKNYHIDAARAMLAKNSCTDDHLLPYSHSMPRNPQCQGLVERGNRTVKSTMYKQMESDGFVMNDYPSWEWVPYLIRVTRMLNRRQVKLYGFSPIILMTGQPPEAPDHQSLTPGEVTRLHEHCAAAMARQGAKMEAKVAYAVFKKGDVVLVHQISKRSHKDLRGKGSRTYTARAVVVRPSPTNPSHYKLRWITDGLSDKEKPGDFSKRMWFAWRLKLAVPTAHVRGYNPYKDDQDMVDEVMNAADTDDASADSEDLGPPLTDHEAVQQHAERCTAHNLSVYALSRHTFHTQHLMTRKCHSTLTRTHPQM
jgi:hypothetical protein